MSASCSLHPHGHAFPPAPACPICHQEPSVQRTCACCGATGTVVEARFRVPRERILSGTRERMRVATARHVAQGALVRMGWRVSDVARAFYRDHSTVVYGARQAQDCEFTAVVQAVIEHLAQQQREVA